MGSRRRRRRSFAKNKNKKERKERKETSLVGGGKPKQEESGGRFSPRYLSTPDSRNTGDEVTGLISSSLCCWSSLQLPIPSRRQRDRCDLDDINLQGIIVCGRAWRVSGAKCQPINFQPEGRHSRRRAPFLYAGEVKTTARFYLRVDLPRWPAVLAWAARWLHLLPSHSPRAFCKQARACLLLFAEVKRSFWEMLRGCVVVHHQLLVCSDLFHRIVYMWHELLSFGDFIRFILGSFSICSWLVK